MRTKYDDHAFERVLPAVRDERKHLTVEAEPQPRMPRVLEQVGRRNSREPRAVLCSGLNDIGMNAMNSNTTAIDDAVLALLYLTGKAVLIKLRVSRDQLLALVTQLSRYLIGVEVYSGAHYWARMFRKYGHTVKLMAPKRAAPYRMLAKLGKNDAAHAATICEAVTRSSVRFVPLKDEHQQATLCLHRRLTIPGPTGSRPDARQSLTL
jgi:hypothetical protein